MHGRRTGGETGEGDRTLGWRHHVREMRADPTLRREADMMGFYACMTLLVALSAGGSDTAEHTQLDVLWVVWGTTIGMALAHWFALTLSTRLVHDPGLHHSPSEMLLSQIAMAVVVAVIASVVVLASPPDTERLGARLAAALFIGLLVLVESRSSGSSLRRGLAYGSVALGVGVAIATLKWFIAS